MASASLHSSAKQRCVTDHVPCLQGVYRAFVRNAKFMTQSSAPDVAFIGSCVVEMYGLDLLRAYEHAFTYIKQLASLLRGAISSQSKDAYREVYCWQTVNTLELWSKLLAAHHDKEVRSQTACTIGVLMCHLQTSKHFATYISVSGGKSSSSVLLASNFRTMEREVQESLGMPSYMSLCRSCGRWCIRCARS